MEKAAKERVTELFQSAGGMKTIENLALALSGATPEKIEHDIAKLSRNLEARMAKHLGWPSPEFVDVFVAASAALISCAPREDFKHWEWESMSLSSFAGLAARLAIADADIKIATEAALEKTCQRIEDIAKEAIGTYIFNWPQLAELTQEQRVALGFSANEPLLRTGELRDLIGHIVEGNVGYVGTNDPVAKYHEYGTAKIPPRPFLAGALAATEGEIPKIFGSAVSAAMRGGGREFHELKELLHAVKEAGHELKETAKDILNDDRDENR